MSYRNYRAVFAVLVGFHAASATVVFASDEAKKSQSSNSKAIEGAELEKGFRLRAQAAESLGVRFTLVGASQLVAEPGGIVRFQDFTAVYRRRDGWVRMVEIEGAESADGKIHFSSKDFSAGDEIAIQGAPALRVIDMDLWGPKADACGD
ncbi:MAG: hypothetical protein AB7F66_14610 [Bacteriovoracia bacterium]